MEDLCVGCNRSATRIRSNNRPLVYTDAVLGRLCHSCWVRARRRRAADPSLTPHELLERAHRPSQEAKRKLRALLKLTSENTPTAQAARILGIPKGTAYSLIHREHKRLRS